MSPIRHATLGFATALTLLMTTACQTPPPPPSGHGQTAHTTPVSVTLDVPMRYWLHLPAGYDRDPQKRWPMIFFLHGSGERGDDLQRVKVNGPPKFLDQRPDFPAIVVSPQVDEHGAWNPHLLHGLLARLGGTLRIDTARVSATGLSMGGRGAWAWAIEYPDDLAAIAPVSGEGDKRRVCRIRHLPVWGFHGDKDPIVPYVGHQETMNELRLCGGTPRFTTYPGVGHDAWTATYADPALYDWLLAQRRGPAPATASTPASTPTPTQAVAKPTAPPS